MFVPCAQLSYNNKVASLTGTTPFALMFGRRMNELRDYSTATANGLPTPVALDDWKEHQEKIASIIYPAISDRISLGKDRMVEAMKKHKRMITANSFPVGAIVMLRDPLRADKFEPTYVGPYTIIRRTRRGAYALRDATGELLDRHVPPDQLKLVSRRARPVDLENQVYEVDYIAQHRGEPGAYEYLTHWKGYKEPTWEPSSSFLDSAVIKRYWTKLAAEPQQTSPSTRRVRSSAGRNVVNATTST